MRRARRDRRRNRGRRGSVRVGGRGQHSLLSRFEEWLKMQAVDRVPTVNAPSTQRKPCLRVVTEVLGDQLRDVIRFGIRVEVGGLFASQLTQRWDVGAEDRQARQRRLDQGDAEPLLATGKEQGVRHAVEVGYDDVREGARVVVGKKDSRSLEGQL